MHVNGGSQIPFRQRRPRSQNEQATLHHQGSNPTTTHLQRTGPWAPPAPRRMPAASAAPPPAGRRAAAARHQAAGPRRLPQATWGCPQPCTPSGESRGGGAKGGLLRCGTPGLTACKAGRRCVRGCPACPPLASCSAGPQAPGAAASSAPPCRRALCRRWRPAGSAPAA